MKAVYADPPYMGTAHKFYGKMHPEAGDYDNPLTHKRLIEQLSDEYDCWALSAGAVHVRMFYPWMPEDARMGIWVKNFAAFKANVTHAYTWEPVWFRFHRPRTRQQPTWRDHIVEPITLKRGFTGAKPEKVCYWIFEGLNITFGDEFTDMFPGSGAVGRAYDKWIVNHNPPEQINLGAWPAQAAE